MYKFVTLVTLAAEVESCPVKTAAKPDVAAVSVKVTSSVSVMRLSPLPELDLTVTVTVSGAGDVSMSQSAIVIVRSLPGAKACLSETTASHTILIGKDTTCEGSASE